MITIMTWPPFVVTSATVMIIITSIISRGRGTIVIHVRIFDNRRSRAHRVEVPDFLVHPRDTLPEGPSEDHIIKQLPPSQERKSPDNVQLLSGDNGLKRL